MHEDAFNNDELRASVTQSSGVHLMTEMQLFLGVLDKVGKGELRHAAERVPMLGCDECRRRRGD